MQDLAPQEQCPVCQQEPWENPNAVVETYSDIWIHEECRISFMTVIMQFYLHGEVMRFYPWIKQLLAFTKLQQESPL